VNNLLSFDLIVCRNVMIYFGADLMRKILDGFHACLVSGGWLLVGPSEPNMTDFAAFRAVNAPGVTLFQKPGQSVSESRTDVFIPITPPSLPQEALPPSEQLNTSDGPTLADVRSHANSGDWENASRCCERLLERDNLNSTLHFYRALIMEQMKKHGVAEESLRRAVYLDRNSVLAHYYLGVVLQSRGELRQAMRSFENALDLLRLRPDADSFADADGITVAELTKLAKMQLETLSVRS
jgi:chemotaxis protein methyltransferase CheR